MKLLKHIDETIAYRKTLEREKYSLGFVPTMGALHQGHLSLVKRAKRENRKVAVSIFVNPIQFNNQVDLQKYPRTLDSDLKQLEKILEPGDFIFAPSKEEMYPEVVTQTYDFGSLESVMEGAHRPNHFNGVALVVDRLFQILSPTRAYFGEKDFQQLAIIQKLTQMRSHLTEIIPCQIVRESDGLAMSSRNVRLGKSERIHAPQIFHQLQEAKQKVSQGMELEKIRQNMEKELNSIPNFKVEYICFAHESNLTPANPAEGLPFRCFVAVYTGDIRLIDNLSMY